MKREAYTETEETEDYELACVGMQTTSRLEWVVQCTWDPSGVLEPCYDKIQYILFL